MLFVYITYIRYLFTISFFFVMVIKTSPREYLEKIRRGNQNNQIDFYVCLTLVWEKSQGKKKSVIRRIKCQYLKIVGRVPVMAQRK